MINTCGLLPSFSFSFTSGCHRSARKGPYALHPVSQQSPRGCPRNSASIRLVEHRSVSTLEGGMTWQTWVLFPLSPWIFFLVESSYLILSYLILSYLILSYLSRSLTDHWDTTVDYTTSFLHSSRFSAFRSMIFHSRPVHSLTLSSHRFLCLPLRLPP